jgi:hypothetical protein
LWSEILQLTLETTKASLSQNEIFSDILFTKTHGEEVDKLSIFVLFEISLKFNIRLVNLLKISVSYENFHSFHHQCSLLNISIKLFVDSFNLFTSKNDFSADFYATYDIFLRLKRK